MPENSASRPFAVRRTTADRAARSEAAESFGSGWDTQPPIESAITTVTQTATRRCVGFLPWGSGASRTMSTSGASAHPARANLTASSSSGDIAWSQDQVAMFLA